MKCMLTGYPLSVQNNAGNFGLERVENLHATWLRQFYQVRFKIGGSLQVVDVRCPSGTFLNYYNAILGAKFCSLKLLAMLELEDSSFIFQAKKLNS